MAHFGLYCVTSYASLSLFPSPPPPPPLPFPPSPLPRPSHTQLAIRYKTMNELLRLPEVVAMNALHHPHVLHMREVVFQRATGCGYLVLELCERSLLDLIEAATAQGKRLGEARVQMLMRQVLQAVQYMHDKAGLLHCDIKWRKGGKRGGFIFSLPVTYFHLFIYFLAYLATDLIVLS